MAVWQELRAWQGGARVMQQPCNNRVETACIFGKKAIENVRDVCILLMQKLIYSCQRRIYEEESRSSECCFGMIAFAYETFSLWHISGSMVGARRNARGRIGSLRKRGVLRLRPDGSWRSLCKKRRPVPRRAVSLPCPDACLRTERPGRSSPCFFV